MHIIAFLFFIQLASQELCIDIQLKVNRILAGFKVFEFQFYGSFEKGL